MNNVIVSRYHFQFIKDRLDGIVFFRDLVNDYIEVRFVPELFWAIEADVKLYLTYHNYKSL